VRLNPRASLIAMVAAAALCGAGCGGNPGAQGRAAEGVESAKGPADRPGSLSYGTVTSQVKKNETSQAQLIELFGGPNISTTDADGLETWVYERSSSQSDMAGSSDVRNLNAFFGGGVGGSSGGVGGGVAGGTRNADDRSRITNSVRNLTVIIKFNPNKTVRDYSVRQSTF
jgi:hypothetical protein